MRRTWRTRGRRAVILAATVTLAASTMTAHADDPDAQKKKVDGQITATQADLEMVSGQLQTAIKNLAATDKKVGLANADLVKKQGLLKTAQNHSLDMAAQLKTAQGDEAKAKGQLTTINAQQNRTKKLVGGIAAQSYMTGGLGKFDLTLQILMSKQDPSTQMSLADVVLRRQNGVLTDLAGQQARAKATTNRLSAATRRVAGLKIQADNAVTAAATARNNAQKAKTALEKLRKVQDAQRKKLQQAKQQDLKDLAFQKAESVRLGKILVARAAARAKAARDAAARKAMAATTAPRVMPAGANTFLTPPGPLSSIGSGFGMRVNPVLKVPMWHYGDDFPYACRTPVYAAAAGEVVEASSDSVAGVYITIDHGFVKGVNLATMYEHLDSQVVRSGRVSKGQLIGYSGTTGRSTGCHLHFATLVNGQYVDPRGWIS
ncbi:peptidoglycan DD-metalloendopeptidase family protein [Calidifontibacter sp. DB0510]|uniref:Peptidoglycan DD-metalloendopeptidase family protein n=1 Tax=Metallococcus carri TaxID=1656884 RepID=A0A967B0C0_9MICO|nr:peptidoglycan DD-metalloendopeptidase family protein [Metallococcus carri]NHN56444.1 peptidoglycan DD-metalloendopeptidase family protein [Metallococcus carri]NOP36068.1 peptidoglycan DD-metalloendopeptidase family protein [Calidifontibacter sp. DB2511S]